MRRPRSVLLLCSVVALLAGCVVRDADERETIRFAVWATPAVLTLTAVVTQIRLPQTTGLE